jgi:hypothetical protein
MIKEKLKKVNTQIPLSILVKVKKISDKKDWSVMKILGKLIILADKHRLYKEL